MRISTLACPGAEVWGLHVAQPSSGSDVWDKNKKKGWERGEKKLGEIKWGFTDLRCHLLYEVNGVIYVEADHTAQWDLWWWKKQGVGKKGRAELLPWRLAEVTASWGNSLKAHLAQRGGCNCMHVKKKYVHMSNPALTRCKVSKNTKTWVN